MSTWKLESERLYCREWRESDFEHYCLLNSNQDVMRFFPSVYTQEKTRESMNKMIANFEKSQYAYSPCFIKTTDQFIGWVGMMDQEMDGDCFVDIGWRLSPEYWGNGYAPEMAKRFIEHGFNEHFMKKIYAIAPENNLPSISVMKKIGMSLEKSFIHPLLKDSPHLEKCVRYIIENH